MRTQLWFRAHEAHRLSDKCDEVMIYADAIESVEDRGNGSCAIYASSSCSWVMCDYRKLMVVLTDLEKQKSEGVKVPGMDLR